MSRPDRIIYEHSRFRLAWDLIVLLAIITAMLIVPLNLAFDHSPRPTSTVVILMIDALLILDIFLNFRTSATVKGITLHDRKSISRHYIRHGLPFDLLGNIPFELFFFWSDAVALNEPKVLLVRCLSFLRVYRLNVIFNRWKTLGRLQIGHMRIFFFFLMVSVLTHVIACGWYYTAYKAGFPEDSWIVRAEVDPTSKTDSYLRSLYWTVATMTTIGYGDITPERNVEVIYVICVMLLGASLYAYIIGNIASLVSNVDAVRSNYYNKVEMINSYLKVKGTPPEVVDELIAYQDYVWARHGGHIAESLLEDLPQPMRSRMMEHLAGDLLDKIPVFRLCSKELREDLLSVMSSITFAPGYRIVRENTTSKHIYFLSLGKIEIRKEAENLTLGFLESGDYFGYQSLILGRKSTVSLVTRSFCDLFVLDSQAFSLLNEQHPEFEHLLIESHLEKLSGNNQTTISENEII